MAMRAEAAAQARAPASQVCEEGEGEGESARSFVMEIPISVERRWPKIALRGWARGESMVLKRRMAAAPWDE
jgi:hypothetical protein